MFYACYLLNFDSDFCRRLLPGALSGCSGWSNLKIPSPFTEYSNKHINVTLYVAILVINLRVQITLISMYEAAIVFLVVFISLDYILSL
jgi:hypothetical protein